MWEATAAEAKTTILLQLLFLQVNPKSGMAKASNGIRE
jgi:hypothetical protein